MKNNALQEAKNFPATTARAVWMLDLIALILGEAKSASLP